MRLIRFGDPGRERPGLIVDGGRRIDVSGFGADYDEAFFGSGGLGQKPPRFLVDGDVVELGIDGLGSSRQRLRALMSP